MRLRKDDTVVAMDIIKKRFLGKGKKKIETNLLVVMENGYGKQTALVNYAKQNRGGVGIKTAQVTNKTGKVINARIVLPELKDLLIISQTGQVIRIPLKSVSKLGRATQGVILMRFTKGDKVTSITVVEDKQDE